MCIAGIVKCRMGGAFAPASLGFASELTITFGTYSFRLGIR